MKLSQLMEMQKAGALKIGANSTVYNITLGGMSVTDEQCKVIARNLGWTGRSANKGFEMIQKTDKYIRNFNRLLTNENIINTVDIMFESIRKTDTEKVADRIKLVGPGFDITIFHGMPGYGGAYAVFRPEVSTSQTSFACTSMKDLCEYIDALI